jgi:hypothetical protein
MLANRYPTTSPRELTPAPANPSASSQADIAPTTAAGVPCAYSVPAGVAARPQAEPLPPARSGVVPAPSTPVAAAASGLPDSPTASVVTDPRSADTAGVGRASENTTHLLQAIFPIWMPEPLVLTMMGGMVLMGLGAIALFRRRPRPHSASVSYGDRSGRRRPGCGFARSGRQGVRISLRRSRA